jgi:hypothetical protein
MDMKWLLIILALVYLLSPYDLIPGFHALGWLDDIVILFLLFRYLLKIKTNPAGPAWHDTHQDQREGRASGSAGTRQNQNPPRSPYEVLDLPPDADQETIKAAYRKLANQYHPDKVSHLGKEFQELAERKFKEIQEAYQKLVR